MGATLSHEFNAGSPTQPEGYLWYTLTFHCPAKCDRQNVVALGLPPHQPSSLPENLQDSEQPWGIRWGAVKPSDMETPRFQTSIMKQSVVHRQMQSGQEVFNFYYEVSSWTVAFLSFLSAGNTASAARALRYRSANIIRDIRRMRFSCIALVADFQGLAEQLFTRLVNEESLTGYDSKGNMHLLTCLDILVLLCRHDSLCTNQPFFGIEKYFPDKLAGYQVTNTVELVALRTALAFGMLLATIADRCIDSQSTSCEPGTWSCSVLDQIDSILSSARIANIAPGLVTSPFNVATYVPSNQVPDLEIPRLDALRLRDRYDSDQKGNPDLKDFDFAARSRGLALADMAIEVFNSEVLCAASRGFVHGYQQTVTDKYTSKELERLDLHAPSLLYNITLFRATAAQALITLAAPLCNWLQVAICNVRPHDLKTIEVCQGSTRRLFYPAHWDPALTTPTVPFCNDNLLDSVGWPSHCSYNRCMTSDLNPATMGTVVDCYNSFPEYLILDHTDEGAATRQFITRLPDVISDPNFGPAARSLLQKRTMKLYGINRVDAGGKWVMASEPCSKQFQTKLSALTLATLFLRTRSSYECLVPIIELDPLTVTRQLRYYELGPYMGVETLSALIKHFTKSLCTDRKFLTSVKMFGAVVDLCVMAAASVAHIPSGNMDLERALFRDITSNVHLSEPANKDVSVFPFTGKQLPKGKGYESNLHPVDLEAVKHALLYASLLSLHCEAQPTAPRYKRRSGLLSWYLRSYAPDPVPVRSARLEAGQLVKVDLDPKSPALQFRASNDDFTVRIKRIVDMFAQDMRSACYGRTVGNDGMAKQADIDRFIYTSSTIVTRFASEHGVTISVVYKDGRDLLL